MQKKTRGVGDVWQSESSLAAKPEWLAGLYQLLPDILFYMLWTGRWGCGFWPWCRHNREADRANWRGIVVIYSCLAWRGEMTRALAGCLLYTDCGSRVDRRVSPRVDPGSILTDCHEHLSGSARVYDPHCPPTDQHKLGQRWAITAACRVKVTTPTLCHCH